MRIKIIGFDLDQTLYPKSVEIDQAIQKHIYMHIANYKKCSLAEANVLFNKYYPVLSGKKTLVEIGLPNPEQIIQYALENADFEKFLMPNPAVIQLLCNIKKKYGSLSLISGSSRHNCELKLGKLNIPLKLFDCIISGEVSKSDGTAFHEWMKYFCNIDSTLTPTDFLYIGDRVSTDAEIPLSLGMQAILVNVTKPDHTLLVPQLASVLDLNFLLE